jgi:hypothetical protein
MRATCAGESLHGKWVQMTDADVIGSGCMQILYCCRMFRFNSLQLWRSLIRLARRRLPPQS